MVLVDSSSWIESLRPSGRPDVRRRVQAILAAGDAAWCEMVRLELWNGARGDQQKRALREFDEFLPRLAIDDRVWELAIEWARQSRTAGLTVPAEDLIILACARRHSVMIEHCDEHFRQLEKIV
jgi:predicted nucleic acid-binding protein